MMTIFSMSAEDATRPPPSRHRCRRAARWRARRAQRAYSFLRASRLMRTPAGAANAKQIQREKAAAPSRRAKERRCARRVTTAEALQRRCCFLFFAVFKRRAAAVVALFSFYRGTPG